jgi:hypothetical protein
MAAAAIAAALVASIVSISSNRTAEAGQKGVEGAGPKAVAHYADAKVIPGNEKGPSPRLFRIGFGAGEPSIGITNEGNVFYAALPSVASKIVRSTNSGKTWEDVNPRLPSGQETHRISLDPYVHVDETEGVDRIFTIDLTVACSYMSFSDDEGESWITNPLACGRPVNDHQTLFTGPPVSSLTLDYPNMVYYCWNDVASSSCSKSIDGGLTFRPTGFPAYPGVKTDDGEFCGGLHGHGHVGPEGNVYLGREYCGQPWIAISKDEGTTWTNVQVAKNGTTAGGDPSIATDRKGNIYYLYISSKDRLPYLVISKNDGKTWTKPMMVAPPGVVESNLPTIDVSAPGKIAFAYYGSDNSAFPKCKRKCEEKHYADTTWNGHMTISANALDADPVFYSTTVNAKSDPMKRLFCGFPPGNRGSNRCDTSVYDFIDLQIAPNGTVWGAFVDACTLVCAARNGAQDDSKDGVVGHLVGGPGLL